MIGIKDERGFNQIFESTPAAILRKERRCDYMISKMDMSVLTPDTYILEIGCGTGEAIKYISEKTGANSLGIDFSNKFIDLANQRYKNKKLHFEVADFNDPLTFKGAMSYGKFDYVIGNGILHHLYYTIDNSLLNLHKLLKSNGKIIFIEPNVYNPYVALIFNIPYFRKKAFLEPAEMAFSSRFIQAKLRQAKFSAYRTEIKDFLLPNIPNNLINFTIKLGNILEHTPLTYFAQSVFITAVK
ncbi:MAG: class I SAM-dependent methyltransferase [Bacteroidetes bacterium]|nr:MAG: class I SAM-dependent methyltransferase [Bacteroidota bacterium]